MKNLNYLNTAKLMEPHAHGRHGKTVVVWHETVSADIPGLADIEGVEKFLAEKDYGIHGMTDKEGHLAWAYGLGKAIFYHAGGLNTPSIGIENVSPIPAHSNSMAAKRVEWEHRQVQLHALAKLCAAIHQAYPHIPLKYVEGDGKHSGFTSHYSVSKYFARSEGHSDCRPVNEGGYFPTSEILRLARGYAGQYSLAPSRV